MLRFRVLRRHNVTLRLQQFIHWSDEIYSNVWTKNYVLKLKNNVQLNVQLKISKFLFHQNKFGRHANWPPNRYEAVLNMAEAFIDLNYYQRFLSLCEYWWITCLIFVIFACHWHWQRNKYKFFSRPCDFFFTNIWVMLHPLQSNPMLSTIHTRWLSVASAMINHNLFWQQAKRVRWTAVAGTYWMSNGDDLRLSQQAYWIHGLSEWQYLCFQYFISSVSLACIDHYQDIYKKNRTTWAHWHQQKKYGYLVAGKYAIIFDKFRIKMMIWTFFYFDGNRALICAILDFRRNFNEICLSCV